MFGLTANMSLTEVKAAVISKASAGGFLSPIISFLKDMSLEWADVPTALATQRDGKPVIMLGRAFFAKHVKNESEAADVVLHEIMHHVFLHLARSEHYTALGYSFHLQNLAMDAIINAYLARFNCAGFMERFYDRLRAGLAPARALREVQLETLREQPHPYLWAAFVLHGGW